MRAAGKKKGRRIVPPGISARLIAHITLETQTDGTIVAYFDGYAVGLGKFSPEAAGRAQGLSTGLPLGSFASDGDSVDKEINLLVRRLARRGLLEYRLGNAEDDRDRVVVEPQTSDYWPQTPALDNADVVVLSRFAYLRRRGSEMVLEIAACRRVVSESAIRRSRPPSRCSRRRNRSKNSGGRTTFRGPNFWRCWWIARYFSRSTQPAAMACAPPKATANSFCGIFTTFCSTPTVRKGGTPIHWAGFIPMPA